MSEAMERTREKKKNKRGVAKGEVDEPGDPK